MAGKASSPNPTTCIALLRGINVGGKNKLPMRDLTALMDDLGGMNIRTYIQSGNVVFEIGAARVKSFPSALQKAIAQSCGITTPVVLFDAGAFARIIAENPFLQREVDESHLHVALLSEPVDRKRLAALDPQRSPGDTFEADARAIYLHLPNGVARTKLTNQYLDRTLGVVSTVRNWRTMLKLRELAIPNG